MKKRGSKGIEIDYPYIEISEYLMPNNLLTIDDKRKLFSIRNKMENIPSNFSSKQNNVSKCFCGETEDMKHIYVCKYSNDEEILVEYEKIFCGNLSEQSIILRRFEENFVKRKQCSEMKKEEISTQAILNCDPLLANLLVHGNG